MKHLREPINGFTRLVGAILALITLGALVGTATALGKERHALAFLIFGLSLVGLYTASALYHLLPLSARGLTRLRRLDHMTHHNTNTGGARMSNARPFWRCCF